MRVGVRVVFREARPDSGMTFLTGREPLRRPHGRAGIACGVDLVRRVTVRACRHARKTHGADLAVIRVAICLELALVTAAALLEEREPAGIRSRRDRVGRMAVGAHRDARVALRELLAVNRRRVLVEDFRVARAAGRRDARPRDGALRVALRAADLVVAVAGRAVRGDLEAGFLEGLAVDRVVEADRLAPVGPARARKDLRVTVAAHAGLREVEMVRPRGRFPRREDVVCAVAVRAPGRLAQRALRARRRVPALAIVLDLLRVARRAIGLREFFGMREVDGLREVGVAVNAGRADEPVDGCLEGLLVDEDRGPALPLGGRVLVAGETVVVGGRLGGRGGRRPEGGGGEEKRGEYSPDSLQGRHLR